MEERERIRKAAQDYINRVCAAPIDLKEEMTYISADDIMVFPRFTGHLDRPNRIQQSESFRSSPLQVSRTGLVMPQGTADKSLNVFRRVYLSLRGYLKHYLKKTLLKD